jgi:hypothetical protein
MTNNVMATAPQSAAPASTALLAHMIRYGLTTAPAVAALGIFDGCDAANRALTSMCRRNLAFAASLYGDKHYFRLTPRGEQAAGSSSSTSERSEPPRLLSAPANLKAYAMLAFCCRRQAQHQRLTEAEIELHWPGLLDGGRAATYYANLREPALLGFLRIDTGGHGRWDRIVEKVRNDIDRHAHETLLHPLIAAGRFEIALATPFPQKATRIAEGLKQFRDAARVKVRVLAMQELLYLIAPPPLT